MSEPPLDMVIRSGDVVAGDARHRVDVGIRDGRIAVLGTSLRGVREIDARGCLVLPGIVDPHVHFSATPATAGGEPEFADDFWTGSRTALAGGVTTVGQMSFPVADEGIRAAVERDEEAARSRAAVDHYFHAGLISAPPGTADEIAHLAGRGHRSLKIVMLAFDWDHSGLVEAIDTARRFGMITLAHCEDHALVDFATRRVQAQGGGVDRYPETRPPVSERAAVERLLAICELTGAPVYVVHLSASDALDAARRGRHAGLPVMVETRPLYLGSTSAVHAEPDGYKQVGMPPIREREDVEALWRGLANGSIDTVGSDHAPWTLEQKREHIGDLACLRKGVAELETMLPLLWTEGVVAGRITPETLVRVTATNAARIFGLRNKGSISVGADADLVILDPNEHRLVDGSGMESAAGYSVYDGRRLQGWPRWTLSRGDVVYGDGEVIANPGRGRRVQQDELRRTWQAR
ncbi:amidohydrolase family protein [Solicola gregarius]|uniref:D-hydantoinase n=1 Tax=Solicola gregarius TaxID=2908642 RepID=A0AA46YKR6_9ACTN|nr:amidohydrolase family protein [Solicola gregarius]UYM06060.1 amidohydrolase family protein [Solicola gregarius]